MAPEPAAPPKGKAIILVVDRDPHIRDLEAHFLEEAGFSVVFEQVSKNALERAQAIAPDIIITEILVPQLDGLSLCRRLKADPKTRGIAVLVFSVLATSGRAREAGADAFLQKPLTDHLIVDTVRALLAAQKRETR